MIFEKLGMKIIYAYFAVSILSIIGVLVLWIFLNYLIGYSLQESQILGFYFSNNTGDFYEAL
jgi:uncharacterized membrane protein